MGRAALTGLLFLAACTGGDDTPVDAVHSGTAELDPAERIARLLRADEASSLQVRAFVPEGIVVPQDPWPRLTELLEQVTDKPGGITVDVQEVPLPDQAWSFADLNATLDGLTVEPEDDVAVIDVLAVHGSYTDDDDNVLGLGWGWGRIAVLVDPITTACTDAAGGSSSSSHGRICEATWAAILRHETGHVLGLVNNELPMVEDHEDPDHLHHDPDPDCLMYHAWDRSELSGRVADEDLELCPASLADLTAFRDG